MRERSKEKELIDLGLDYYSPDEYEDCLVNLGRIGKILGGDRATLNAFKGLAHEPLSILDVGCGGGCFTKQLAEAYPHAEVVGIDINPLAIHHAQHRIGTLPPNLRFEHRSNPKLNDAPGSFDVVTATSVCHHLSDQELISFLQSATRVARASVVLNDLHRHWLAHFAFSLLAPPLFRNRLITHDGLISIRRAFTKNDWHQLLSKAGLSSHRWSLTWNFVFRWIVTIPVQ